jgi:hypothetical protein
VNIERSSGPDLLPRRYDVERLEPRVREMFFVDTEWLTEELRRTAFWSYRLMDSFDTWEAARQIPGLIQPAFGFLDPDTELDGFGVIVLVRRPINASLIADIPYRRELVVDDERFPIVIRPVDVRAHISNPSGGTSACVATSRGRVHGPAYLTAKHVVGSLGSVMTLSCGCTGNVCDVGPEGIDVALVESSCSVHVGNVVNAKMLVPPWLDVTTTGASSGNWQTKISAVSDTRGVLTSAHLPSRLFLAQAGRGGDSGALVTSVVDGEPVGIYLGELADPSGRTEGIAQHCYQAVTLMDLELFK